VRAAVLRESPGWLELTDLEVDSPRAHEVLIRTLATGLCHSDLHFVEGNQPAKVPLVLGHESAGVVEEVGSEVTYVQPGDHVITCPSVFCGTCEYCLTGRPFMCSSKAVRRTKKDVPRLTENGERVNQLANLGGFAEQMLVHENSVVKVTAELPADRAALIGCCVTTGLGAVFNSAKLWPCASMAVLGCGAVGLSCIQAGVIAGARQIIAIDVNAARLELASRIGASQTLDASAVDVVAEVAEVSGGGVDFSFEAIGLSETAEQAFDMLKPGGTATVIGMIKRGDGVRLSGRGLLQSKRMQGCGMGSNRFRVEMPWYIDLYFQGRLRLDELLSDRIKLDDVNQGLRDLQAGRVVRDVVVFDHGS
jgi:S-(hydroxymethyl)glutathione dehydrogenase / alcohol dehydrogenase